MPGTIQVTVLEFKGVSSSSKPSAKSLKVSMGKIQYQTWDKGDFSFPITKLREDLVVTLLDAGGNEITHADIRTMQIIEKGSWDEVFSINGGGHVHMKLQFILNNEERNRIRIMRESAMKKKLETNPNVNLRLSDTVSSTYDPTETSTKDEQKISDVMSRKVEASQAGSPLNPATSSDVLENAIPNTSDGSPVAPSSPGKNGVKIESPQESQQLANIRSEIEENVSSKLSVLAISDKNNSVASKLHEEKTPSNVKKMISAFENSQLQEAKTLKKSSSVPSHLGRFRKEFVLEHPAEKRLRNFKDQTIGASQAPKKLDSTVTSGAASREPSLEKSDLIRQSISERATSSGRMIEEQSQVTHASSVAEGSRRERGTSLKSSTMINIELASILKPKSIEYHKEEFCSAQRSGMWIFPDNTRRLCITTAGKQVMKIVGHHHNEAKTHQVNTISSGSQVLEKNLKHGTKYKMEKNQKKNANQQESGCGSSPDDSSNGLVGRVIKIAVILGFGVLVLLTRQKEPRKKHREENVNIFPIPDYVDEGTLKPWLRPQ